MKTRHTGGGRASAAPRDRERPIALKRKLVDGWFNVRSQHLWHAMAELPSRLPPSAKYSLSEEVIHRVVQNSRYLIRQIELVFLASRSDHGGREQDVGPGGSGPFRPRLPRHWQPCFHFLHQGFVRGPGYVITDLLVSAVSPPTTVETQCRLTRVMPRLRCTRVSRFVDSAVASALKRCRKLSCIKLPRRRPRYRLTCGCISIS